MENKYLWKLLWVPRMPRYEFLEPLKPIIYRRFVQRCNKTVNPNFNIQTFLIKHFYINLFAVIYGSLLLCISTVEYSGHQECWLCGLCRKLSEEIAGSLNMSARPSFRMFVRNFRTSRASF
jgi:hypothetical protein